MHDHAFRLESAADVLPLQVYVWHAKPSPRATLVIAHGAGEHALRYDRFAQALTPRGIEVVGYDHRGHGRSTGPRGVGDFGKGGWPALVADLGQVIERVRESQPRLPVGLFAHSMGSFAAQKLCHDRSSSIDAVVLSGSTVFEPPSEGEPEAPLNLNAPFEPARTAYDWLSRDEDEVDRYVADPLCGFEALPWGMPFSPEDLLEMSEPKRLEGIRPDLPVLLVSGEADPLHRELRGLRLLEERWRAAGVRRVDRRYYPDARHELLNELNREEVTRDVAEWLEQALRR